MNLHTNHCYLQGALGGRDFLCRMQVALKLHRQFEPRALRAEYKRHLQDKPAEYQAGFLDAIGAYMLITLEGVLVDVNRWEVLRVLECADQQK